ncbi:MAG: GNAT family N-acetyltransferase [Clostridiales bacterium]|nr:GNAT family N-acetyltransferase [Clostridiales bacterium]
MEIKQIRDPQQKMKISTDILKMLPEWFGIPEAVEDYIHYSSNMPFFAVYSQSKAVGFIAIKENNRYTAEVYVMGVNPNYHRRGIGRALISSAVKWCWEHGYEFLQVKTLDKSHSDKNYACTRKFYEAMGFRPLECIPELWGKDNPCLIMVMYIGEEQF